MAKIKVVSDRPLIDGLAITVNAPCECNAVDGLTVSYLGESQSFTFRDSHGNDLTGLGNLFSEGAYIRVVLDTTNGYAYLQNADTNAYIEETFLKRSGGTMTGVLVLTEGVHYGKELPPAGTVGRLFFKVVESDEAVE